MSDPFKASFEHGPLRVADAGAVERFGRAAQSDEVDCTTDLTKHPSPGPLIIPSATSPVTIDIEAAVGAAERAGRYEGALVLLLDGYRRQSITPEFVRAVLVSANFMAQGEL